MNDGRGVGVAEIIDIGAGRIEKGRAQRIRALFRAPGNALGTGVDLAGMRPAFHESGSASVQAMEFSRELRSDVMAGDITLSVRLWKQPRVKPGGRYGVGLGEIEVDAVELV